MGGGDKSTALRGVAALNVYKKVAIIRSSDDVLSYEDADGTVKTVTDLHLAGAVTTPVHKAKPKNDIPVPTIKTVETYKTDVPPNYDCPTSYVRYRRPTQQELQDNVEYVIDAEDEVWLINNSKFGGQQQQPQNHDQTQPDKAASSSSNKKQKRGSMSMDTQTNDDSTTTPATTTATTSTFPLPLGMLESMMDILEKATAFEAIITTDQAEQMILAKLPQLYHMYPIKARAGVVTIKHVLTDVYNYWVSKRSKLKRPLLRRFWPVTSSDDTNPHLVFRPREKEKYKLRKKRQNDMDAHRKLVQLKQDFEQVRVILKFVKQREELNRKLVHVQKEWFQQKIHDATDTSGLPRVSSTLARDEMQELLTVPQTFDLQGGWKKNKKSRRGSSQQGAGGAGGGRASQTSSPVPEAAGSAAAAAADGTVVPAASSEPVPLVVAGQNHGEPAPNFLHPLSTREHFATSWENAVPHVTSFVNATPEPTYHFRHRPRVGRGGRLNIDRMPIQLDPNFAPTTVFRAGNGQLHPNKPKRRLLDLLPEALDYEAVSGRITDICLTSLKEDYDRHAAERGAIAPLGTAVDAEENDGDVVVVNASDWLHTDDQLWGEERYSIGPV